MSVPAYMEQDGGIMADLEARVARGAARLDEVDRDWYKKIDKLRLDIRNSLDCTCGQWDNGNYSRALRKLKIPPGEAQDHGFNGPNADIPLLTELWIQAIELREFRELLEPSLEPEAEQRELVGV